MDTDQGSNQRLRLLHRNHSRPVRVYRTIGGEMPHFRSATNQQSTTGYIGPMHYEDLIAANSAGIVDSSSKQILEREMTYIQNWRRVNNRGDAMREIDTTVTGLALSGGG